MSQNFFITKHGTPQVWTCPDCGVNFHIYPGLPFDKDNHNCAKTRPDMIPVCPCWWILKDDHRVEAFVVQGLPFPEEMSVETLNPEGKPEFWERREKNGLTIFVPPKHYKDAEFFRATLDVERGALMRPGPRQKLQLVPRPLLEKLALNNRHSVDLSLR